MENGIQIQNFRDIITINDYSRIRKHTQIVNSVLNATSTGSLRQNDKLPSVNELAFDHNISRDTVVRAYTFLKENNIIDSVPGKGYYIKMAANEHKIKVFLLFSKLGHYEKNIFDALSNNLSENATIDLYVYQNDCTRFKKHITDSKQKDYTHFVITADFFDEQHNMTDFIKNEVPQDKLIMLDKKVHKPGEAASVYQDFGGDIYNALIELNPLLKKYKTIKLVCSEKSSLTLNIKEGLFRFCKEFSYIPGVMNCVNEKIERNTAYIDIEENDLIYLVKQIKSSNFIIGEDIGIISYNDSCLKEVLLDGITVITTDFDYIGRQIAYLILNNRKEQIRSRFDVKIRNSL